MLNNIINEALIVADSFSKKNMSSFGYRERIQIERLLYLSLKVLMAKYGLDLHGFSNPHLENLRSAASNHVVPPEVAMIIEDAFQLKIYLKNISSSNAYVRNDTLLRLTPDLEKVMPLISNRFRRVVTRIGELSTQAEH